MQFWPKLTTFVPRRKKTGRFFDFAILNISALNIAALNIAALDIAALDLAALDLAALNLALLQVNASLLPVINQPLGLRVT